VSPAKNPTGRPRTRRGVAKPDRRPAKAMDAQRAAKGSGERETSKAQILRSTHVHRSRAHTASRGRRQQARRDTK
jgi:hypothetical protein